MRFAQPQLEIAAANEHAIRQTLSLCHPVRTGPNGARNGQNRQCPTKNKATALQSRWSSINDTNADAPGPDPSFRVHLGAGHRSSLRTSSNMPVIGVGVCAAQRGYTGA